MAFITVPACLSLEVEGDIQVHGVPKQIEIVIPGFTDSGDTGADE